MDRDFDPSAEILVHDFDDERTLEEEEAMYPEDDSQAELTSLQKDQEMPLEVLLASYGIEPKDDDQSGNQYFSEDDDEGGEEEEEAEAEDEEDDEGETGEEESEPSPLKMMYEADPSSRGVRSCPLPPSSSTSSSAQNVGSGPAPAMSARGGAEEQPPVGGQRKMHLLRSVCHQSDEEEEDEDFNYIPDDKLPWKKAVNVGPEFQAEIPALVSKDGPDPRTYHPDDDDGGGGGGLATCQWAAGRTREHDVVEFLKKARLLSDDVRRELQGLSTALLSGGGGSSRSASHSGPVRDNEHALRLFRECNYNAREALTRWTVMAKNDEDHDFNLWSEDETRLFENGLLQYGKDFYKLHHFVVRSRTRAELVEYYYFWKKSLRHDVAVSRFGVTHRLEKKKYALNPNTTEMMDRIMDEQQQNAWPGSSSSAASSSSSSSSSSHLNSLHATAPLLLSTSASSSSSFDPKTGSVHFSATGAPPVGHGRSSRLAARSATEISS